MLARPSAARLWLASHLQTCPERDVRAVTVVRDLVTFRRFLALGVSVPTVTQWLGVLETTAQVLMVPPFYENLGKRLIKSPRIAVPFRRPITTFGVCPELECE